MQTESQGALKGIKVVEMGQLIAGPFCGQLLGDMGAEIAKIEPPNGDPMREWGQGEIPTWFRVLGRNKYSVMLDLRTREGQDTARELILKADILIENFRPGTLEKWGLSPTELMAANPRLIVARISGYGQTGPYKDRTGFGGVAECMGGWRKIVGDPDGPPARMGVSIGDSLAASYTAMGILAALHARNQTGLGQIIDTALYESVLQVMEAMIPEYAVTGHKRTRTGAILPKIAPSSVYPCIDGEYMIGGNGDAIFARLSAAMSMPELAQDPRYKSHLARGENQIELDEIIANWTKTKTIAELTELMLQHGVPASRLYDAEDMLADPHFAARNAIIEVPDEILGDTKMQGTFPKLSLTPSSVRRAAPREVGQDTQEILARWLRR